MELKKITDRVYYLPSTSETDRPVLGYVKGDTYSFMVDAGNSVKHVELFHKAIDQSGLPSPDYVAITHWHWDHTFGMHAVRGKTITSRLTNEELVKVAEWEWSDEAMDRRLRTGEDIEFCDRCIRLEYPDRNEIIIRTGDMVFEDHLVLDLGNVHCELKRIGGTHSEDSVVVYIPEEKVIFVGDAISGDFYHNNGEYEKSKLIDLIQCLSEYNADIFLLGHDEPCPKEEVMEYLKEELDKL